MSLRLVIPTFAFLIWNGVLSPARAQAPGGINFPELFQSLDVNDDKVIARSEVPESGRAAFDRLVKLADTNKDGRIDQEEYREILVRARDSALSALPKTSAEFESVDKNGDGKISRDEFTGLPNMFGRADADSDGFLTLTESAKFRETAMSANLPGAGQFGPRFLPMDKNGDKKISRDEFTGIPGNFEKIDVNKDGFLTPIEVRQFVTGGQAGVAKAEITPSKDSKPKPTEKPTSDAK